MDFQQRNNINEEEEDEMPEEYEVSNLSGSYNGNSYSASDYSQVSAVNLDKKMRAMQGYAFKHNKNFKAMKKVIPNEQIQPKNPVYQQAYQPVYQEVVKNAKFIGGAPLNTNLLE